MAYYGGSQQSPGEAFLQTLGALSALVGIASGLLVIADHFHLLHVQFQTPVVITSSDEALTSEAVAKESTSSRVVPPPRPRSASAFLSQMEPLQAGGMKVEAVLAGGTQYAHSLRLSPTFKERTIEFALSGEQKTLNVQFGFPDNSPIDYNWDGYLQLRILGDGEELCEPCILRAKDQPQIRSLPIKGVHRLAFLYFEKDLERFPTVELKPALLDPRVD